MSLRLVPIEFSDAVAFVRGWHRHNKPPVGHKFSIGVADDSDTLVGVATVGRPVSSELDDGLTLELTRSATDGHPNANSMLYAAAWRAGKAMGFRRMVTYTQGGETGGSLLAAGWQVVAELKPRGGWKCASRPNADPDYLSVPRKRWEIGA